MKKVLIVGLIVLVAGSAFAQLSQSIVVTEKDGNVKISKSSKSSVSWGEGQKPSALQSLLGYGGTGRYVIYGRVPLAYNIIGLTDEQLQSIKDLCAEASGARMEIYKSYSSQRRNKEDYKKALEERRNQESELVAKYEARIAELLTAEQKAALEKIKKIADAKLEADKKVSEDFRAARDKVKEEFEAKLKAALTPEQIEKLEKAIEDMRTKRHSRHSRHQGGQ